jgi:pimeloyl-ACP methyl ester carboxylesterase
MVGQVTEVMDRLSLERPAVVAHSMGGAIATHIGLRHRERIRALVLLGPIGFGESRPAVLARLVTPAWSVPLLSAGLRRWVVDRILSRIYGDAGSHDERDVDEYWAPARFGGFVPAMHALVHHFRWTAFTWEELLELRTRCLLIRGDRDPVVRPMPGEDLARYANARETVIRGAGHVVHDEVAAEVNGTVLRFLEDAWRS